MNSNTIKTYALIGNSQDDLMAIFDIVNSSH